MKSFVIQYNPHHTVKEMFDRFEQGLEGKRHIQPKSLMLVSDLGVIDKLITKSRLELFACLQEKKPASISELVKLLARDYQGVEEDVQILKGMDIIKLEGEGEEAKPVALYEKIVLDLSSRPIREEARAANFYQPVTRI